MDGPPPPCRLASSSVAHGEQNAIIRFVLCAYDDFWESTLS